MADVDKAKRLLSRFFTTKSELGREMALFNALMETKVENREIAVSLLGKVKNSAKRQNQKTLDEEKSHLIDEIKNTLRDPEFFERQISEYKDYATVQVLLNACRGIGFKGTIKELVELEDGVLKRMVVTEKRKEPNLDVLELTDGDIDGLVFKLMTEKTNAKFSGILNEEQQQLVKLYAFTAGTDLSALRSKLLEIRTVCSKMIFEAHESMNFDKRVRDKLIEAKNRLEGEFSSLEKIDDSTVTFYMTLLKLKEELLTK
jgi:hypothetical protein